MVNVENEISSLQVTFTITVQLCPHKIKMTYNGPKNVSAQLTFTADPGRGSDLEYTFDFGDGSANVTQQDPVVLHTYNMSNTYNATVTVTNHVCTVYGSLLVIVMDANTLIIRKISHMRYATRNQVVLFTADVITLNTQGVKFVWSSNGVSLQLTGSKEFNSTFATVGDHNVTVNLTLIQNPSIARYFATVITIQEQIARVSLSGQALVSFSQSQAAVVSFTATAMNGTDIEYSWYNGTTALADTSPSVNITMDVAGVFNISVAAHNWVSQLFFSCCKICLVNVLFSRWVLLRNMFDVFLFVFLFTEYI
jgi:PKD repeat protein